MKIPVCSASDVKKLLERHGFQQLRQKGSHRFFRHPDGRTTVLPDHPGEPVDRHLLNKIIKHDCKMRREEFFQHTKR